MNNALKNIYSKLLRRATKIFNYPNKILSARSKVLLKFIEKQVPSYYSLLFKLIYGKTNIKN